MHAVAIAALMALWAPDQTAASQETAVVSVVDRFVAAFNQGDTKSAAAACAGETSIVDEFPPHEWHGAGACTRWMKDYDADAKKNGITDGVVTLGKPRHVDVTGDRAYVVAPADYAYKKGGKPVKETGSILTVALRREGSAWRIVGWAWSKN